MASPMDGWNSGTGTPRMRVIGGLWLGNLALGSFGRLLLVRPRWCRGGSGSGRSGAERSVVEVEEVLADEAVDGSDGVETAGDAEEFVGYGSGFLRVER